MEFKESSQIKEVSEPNPDQPVRVESALPGQFCLEWRRGGVLHRDDGPACEYHDQLSFSRNRPSLLAEYWYQNGQKHRDKDPAYIRYDNQSRLIVDQVWYQNDQIHRPHGGPARVTHHRYGSLSSQAWYWGGVLHRGEGPAVKRFYWHGGRASTWYQNGQIHRDDGPAWIKWHPNGVVAEKVWWDRGLPGEAVAFDTLGEQIPWSRPDYRVTY